MKSPIVDTVFDGLPPRQAPARPAGRIAAHRSELLSVGRTQAALYGGIASGLDLSWSEHELRERERTKHVHRLHPYLGKFIPQLVERLLDWYVRPGGRVLDPFAGSGTTLVQSLESGYDVMGVDIAAFNALLMRVKTREYELPSLRRELVRAQERALMLRTATRYPPGISRYVRDWYAPSAASELVEFRSLIEDFEHREVLQVVLARAARSARRTPHYDLDFPSTPQVGEYWCHKHRRRCRPVERAAPFLARYTLDTLERIEAFGRVRKPSVSADVLHGDAREARLEGTFDGIVTSPPYPGLIDYHEQHRYAYELLGLEQRVAEELGSPRLGQGRGAIEAYVQGIVAVLANAVASLEPGAHVVVVVNDRRDLYPEILRRAGLALVDRLERHVNRRTGRRAGEYFESVLVAVVGSR